MPPPLPCAASVGIRGGPGPVSSEAQTVPTGARLRPGGARPAPACVPAGTARAAPVNSFTNKVRIGERRQLVKNARWASINYRTAEGIREGIVVGLRVALPGAGHDNPRTEPPVSDQGGRTVITRKAATRAPRGGAPRRQPFARTLGQLGRGREAPMRITTMSVVPTVAVAPGLAGVVGAPAGLGDVADISCATTSHCIAGGVETDLQPRCRRDHRRR